MIRQRSIGLRWGVGFLIVIGLSLSTLLWLGSQVRADFPTTTTLLSQNSVCDIDPRAAISGNGNWLAATWIQGRLFNGGCISRGQAAIRWATETEAQSNWTASTYLPLPGGACAVHSDVALDETSAHVAVSYWLPCDALDRDSAIRYYTCDLASGSCTSRGDAVYLAGSSGKLLSDVRIVLDDQSRPHIAYAEGTASLAASDIKYTRLSNSAWTPSIIVSTGDKINGFYRPVIAASQNRIHFVWERHRDWTDSQGRKRYRGDVQYRYCDADSGVCSPDIPITYPYPDATLDNTTYPLPTLNARDGRVVLVWNVCADVNPDPPCENYYLLYARSNDNGQTLTSPKEVGSELPVSILGMSTRSYPGSDAWADLDSEYASYLRPSVTLDGGALPHIGWQVATESGYVISTTHASAGTESGFSWSTDAGWQLGTGADTRVASVVLSVDEAFDAGALHVVHLNAWREDIGDQRASRSQVYYDYLGMRQLRLEAETLSSSHELPEGRRVAIRAQVEDISGRPVPDTEVSFRTDFASFSAEGFGRMTADALTDDQGWAEVLLYANLPGSATIQIWLDGDLSDTWEDGEPRQVVTRTWSSTVSPALYVSTDPTYPGDLITTTVEYHPYETENWPAQATPYVLWWCPQTSGQATKVHDAFTVSPVTWSYVDLIIQVPADSAGQYRLESFIDYGDPNPCGSPDLIASSAYVTIDESLRPRLTVNELHPSPGAEIDVTFLYHPEGQYELWWCPANTDAAPIAEEIGSAAVSNAAGPTIAVTVPQGVSGLYRLESHRDGGLCGQASTQLGVSTLIAPQSIVFLPLIKR